MKTEYVKTKMLYLHRWEVGAL